jgi:hypothetical protein
MAQMPRAPKSFLELFEFMKYVKTKNLIQEAAARLAKARIAAGAV